MNEIVFKPRHNWFSIVFLGLLIASFGVASLLVGYARNNIAGYIIGSVFLLLGLYSIARRSTLIIIGTTEIVMKRALLPNLILDYDNFTDFIGSAFLFGNRGIPVDDMTNAQEFIKIFLPILEMKKIQQTGKYAADLNRTNKALKFSVIPSVVISIVATYLLKEYFDVQYDGKLVAGIISLIMLFVIYFILLKMEEFKKE